MLKGAVVGSFRVLWETAGGQLPLLYMIGEAVTADAFSTAGIIRAVAPVEVRLFFAFHTFHPVIFYND